MDMPVTFVFTLAFIFGIWAHAALHRQRAHDHFKDRQSGLNEFSVSAIVRRRVFQYRRRNQ